MIFTIQWFIPNLSTVDTIFTPYSTNTLMTTVIKQRKHLHICHVSGPYGKIDLNEAKQIRLLIDNHLISRRRRSLKFVKANRAFGYVSEQFSCTAITSNTKSKRNGERPWQTQLLVTNFDELSPLARTPTGLFKQNGSKRKTNFSGTPISEFLCHKTPWLIGSNVTQIRGSRDRGPMEDVPLLQHLSFGENAINTTAAGSETGVRIGSLLAQDSRRRIMTGLKFYQTNFPVASTAGSITPLQNR